VQEIVVQVAQTTLFLAVKQPLNHRGEVWYFTAWHNIVSAGEGSTTQCKSIFLNLAAGDTLEWYL